MTPSSWPSRLVLVRHGESEGNLADARAHAAGAAHLELEARDADVELSDVGASQAAALGRWLAGRPVDERPAVVWSSPYRRAAATAAVLHGALGLREPVRHDERLRERDLGMFDGLTGLGVTDRFPEEAERRSRIGKLYYRPPGGESWCDVALRVRAVLLDLRAEHAGEQVLLVSHQAVIMNFRMVLERLDEQGVLALDRGDPLANCSTTTYESRDGAIALVAANDVTALETHAEPVTEEDDRDDEV